MNQKKSKAIRKLCKIIGIENPPKELVDTLSKFTHKQILNDLPLAEAWREAYNKGVNEGVSEGVNDNRTA